jgi:hypothetical protein
MEAPVGKGDDDPVGEEGRARNRDEPVQDLETTSCDSVSG